MGMNRKDKDGRSDTARTNEQGSSNRNEGIRRANALAGKTGNEGNMSLELARRKAMAALGVKAASVAGRRIGLLGAILILLSGLEHALGASFDCAKARSADQVAICSDQTASILDEIANRGYQFLKTRYSKRDVNRLNKQILAYRQKCGSNTSCIIATQVKTIQFFKKLGAPVEVPSDLTLRSTPMNTEGGTTGQATEGTDASPSPSFDCRDASLPDERQICQNGELAKLDLLTSQGFKKVKALKGKSRAIALGKQFLAQRHACMAEVECIMRSQIAAIRAFAAEGADIAVPEWAHSQLSQLKDPAPSSTAPTESPAADASSLPALRTFDEDMVARYEKTEEGDIAKYRKSLSSSYRDDDIAITGVRIRSDESTSKNTAILIANSSYDFIDSLPGPLVDIELVAQALRYRNFDVHVFKNITRSDGEELNRVAAGANKTGMLLVYYAGHGAIVDGRNSLILKTFNPEAPSPSDQVISIDGLLDQFKSMGFASYLFAFDACRSFVGIGNGKESTRTTQADTRSFRNISIADVKQSDLSGIDYAISFSASEGQEALDASGGGASPYAASFARNIREKNTVIEATLAIRNDVVTLTKGAQDPGLLLKWKTDVPLSSSKAVTVNYGFGPDYGGSSQYLRLPRIALERLPLVKNGDGYEIEEKLQTYDVNISYEDLRRAGRESPEDLGMCSFLSKKHFDWNRMCVQEYIEKKLSENGLVSKSFPGMNATSEQRLRDGVVKRDRYFEISVDLNNDGVSENVTVDSYRDGGVVYINRAGKDEQEGSLAISSFLSPSFDALYLRDFNKDGVLDYVIQQADAFVILDGRRILTSLSNPDVESSKKAEHVDAQLKQYFSSTWGPWCARNHTQCPDGAVVGELAPITLFFDNGNVSYDDQTDSIGYRVFDDTWNTSPESNTIYDRRVYFDAPTREVIVTTAQGEIRLKPVWQME